MDFLGVRDARCARPVMTRKGKKTWIRSYITNREYNFKEFITCNSAYVTHVIECSCKLQYVGRTIRHLSVRIGEHRDSIKKGFKGHSQQDILKTTTGETLEIKPSMVQTKLIITRRG